MQSVYQFLYDVPSNQNHLRTYYRCADTTTSMSLYGVPHHLADTHVTIRTLGTVSSIGMYYIYVLYYHIQHSCIHTHIRILYTYICTIPSYGVPYVWYTCTHVHVVVDGMLYTYHSIPISIHTLHT